jgi:hypothetical protein
MHGVVERNGRAELLFWSGHGWTRHGVTGTFMASNSSFFFLFFSFFFCSFFAQHP